MTKLLGNIDSPTRVLKELMRDGGRVRFSFTHTPWYQDDASSVELHAACEQSSAGLFAIVDNDAEGLDAQLEKAESLSSAANAIRLDAPLALETVRIDKPWGAEVWYTGIETRGVCSVQGTPLPWLIELGGKLVLGGDEKAPVLLKILDPLPDDVYGDLYFEMHEEKIEVYIVTEIDKRAWPDGQGAIRFGFSEERLGEFESRDAFTSAYAESVSAYRQVRNEIDAKFDEFRAAENLTVSDVVRPEKLEAWKARIDPAVIEQERELRTAMNSFTAMQPLQVGDVVRVPPFTPHSLQHGVRVIEFQTPHYERYILSFAQKVLTQDHWDTDEAIGQINWDARFDKSLATIASGNGYTAQMAADFSAFEVHRISIDAGKQFDLPSNDSYTLAISIIGQPRVAGMTLAPEQAALLPANLAGASIETDGDCCLLLALPKSG